MKIKDIINNKKVTVSFEVFPPKQWDKIANTKKIVEEMVKDKPSFMSVTYGAAGTTSGFTTEIANAIKEGGVEPLSHLTCLTSTKEKIDSVLDELEANGIENVLALRGDIPKDFEMGENQYFHHAFELVNEIKARGKFCVGAACYPEKHEEAPNMDTDIYWLKKKMEMGAEYAVTQLFYDNRKYFDFVERARQAGVTIPIIPGIKPFKKLSQLSIIPKTFKVDLPEELTQEVLKCNTDAEAQQVGIEWCVQQCKELIAHGVPSLHFYSVGATDSIREVAKQIY